MRNTSIPQNFRFLLPQVQRRSIGNQGEVARFIPYRLESDMTPDTILQELERQPHMASLAQALDPSRNIYLLTSSSLEQLELAAEYIGTFHRLSDALLDSYMTVCADDQMDSGLDDEDFWQAGDPNDTVFDFSANMPYLYSSDLTAVYGQQDSIFGMGGWNYMPGEQPRRPWWTMSSDAPLAVYCNNSGALTALAKCLDFMKERSLIIVLHHDLLKNYRRSGIDVDVFSDSASLSQDFQIDDISFELECKVISLDEPAADSVYKRQVLRQLASQQGAPLARAADAASILSLIENHRGNADNRTLSKAVSNALLRRTKGGPLRKKDFAYLSLLFNARLKAQEVPQAETELVGQEDVRLQLKRVVDSMSFQKERENLGLPTTPIHYTFAFLGAPGTGKTTWALRLAQEMNRRGLLDNTDSICVNAAELKAKYVGHTTGKVKALFDQYGVIILDEAYSLTEDGEADTFTREALAQLCVELEKHGTDRLVIFAGYGGSCDREDDRMLRFLQSNPGINSRVSFKVHFQNFQPQELLTVFHTMLTQSGYRVPTESDAVVEDFFRQRMGERAFGNCREARNLADRVAVQMSARLSGTQDLTQSQATQVLPQDISAAAEEILTEYQGLRINDSKAIGF